MNKSTFLLTILLSMVTFMGCKNNDEMESLKPNKITTKILCGCTWYNSPDNFLSFFEDGTFEDYYDAGRLGNTLTWRCLYKGTWKLQKEDLTYRIEATYTKVYLNAYEEELTSRCKWDQYDITISNDHNTLYIGNERYERIDYVAPNMTQY